MGYSNIDCDGTRFYQKKFDRKGDGEKWMEGMRRKGCIMACVFGFWHCFCLSIWARKGFDLGERRRGAQGKGICVGAMFCVIMDR